MASQYAKQLASGATNHIKNVAIVGTTGSVGKYLTQELLKTGKHNVSAITRADSKSEVPAGVTAKRVNYDDHASLVEGLKGQDALIITMAVSAPKDTQQKLISAAKDAGVQWILPNEWGYGFDDAEDQLGKDIMLGPKIAETRQYIKQLGLNFIGLTSGFWFEFSLGGGKGRFGFDFKERSLTLFDNGEIKMLTSTWPQTGRAVAKVLSLPILPQDEHDKSLTISNWRNKTIYIKSFYISQQDMLASALRVTGTKESDWKITKEDTKARFQNAAEAMAKGDFSFYVVRMYTRCFFDDGTADFSSKVQNDILGLPQEDLDTCVKGAVDFALSESDGKY